MLATAHVPALLGGLPPRCNLHLARHPSYLLHEGGMPHRHGVCAGNALVKRRQCAPPGLPWPVGLSKAWCSAARGASQQHGSV